MSFASIRKAYAEKLDEQMEAGSIPGKDIPLHNKKPKRRKKLQEELRDFSKSDILTLGHELKDQANKIGWHDISREGLAIVRAYDPDYGFKKHDYKKAKQYLTYALDALDTGDHSRCKSHAAAALDAMHHVLPLPAAPMHMGVGTKVDLDEATNLLGKNLVTYLTNICLDSWYGMVRKFSGNPDTYDVHQSASHPQFETFKMTPGNDKRDDAYEAILSAAASLTKSLNGAFGKNVFEQRVSRTGGGLQVLVAFAAGKGGVFQCKAENNGGDSAINLTMPNKEELIRAFSAMTDTPHPGDELGEIGDDVQPQDVAGDIPPPGTEGETVPTPEIPQPDEVAPAVGSAQVPMDDPNDMISKRRFESIEKFFGQTLSETRELNDSEKTIHAHLKKNPKASNDELVKLLPKEHAAHQRKDLIDTMRRVISRHTEKVEESTVVEGKKWKLSWLDQRGVKQSHVVSAMTADQAKTIVMRQANNSIPSNASFETEEVVEDPTAKTQATSGMVKPARTM